MPETILEEAARLKALLDRHERVVFFGGAGVSTESGIPDFRSVDGLYHQKYDVPPETILSHSYFVRHTAEFYRFYRDKMLPLDAKPNPAHFALAKLEQDGKLIGVVTQNIDGLHQKAGSKRVYELHGSVHRNYCTRCGKFYPPEYIRDSEEEVPHCSCGGVIKPDVVLYEEGLDSRVMQDAAEAIDRADLLLVGGTSLVVYPAAGFVASYRGGTLALLNRDPTPYDGRADEIFRQPIGKLFEAIMEK